MSTLDGRTVIRGHSEIWFGIYSPTLESWLVDSVDRWDTDVEDAAWFPSRESASEALQGMWENGFTRRDDLLIVRLK